MKIRLFGLNLLPSNCRARQALFIRACRFALGRRAARNEELNLIFVRNREIRRINKRFLGHDFNTDVIAFPYAQPPAFGDVYVSVDQARIQAKDLGHTLLKELLTLAIHGTLHLMGFDDHVPAKKKKMFAKQDAVLRKLRLAALLIALIVPGLLFSDARAAELDVAYGQDPPLDIRHPDYDCVFRPTTPAVSGSHYSVGGYSVSRKRELGPYTQPQAAKKARVLEEILVLRDVLIRFRHLSCVESWMIVKVSLPVSVANKTAAEKLRFAAKQIGRVALSGSASAKEARAIARTLRAAAGLADLSKLSQVCDPEREDQCLTICLDRRNDKCRADVSMGIDSSDLTASYVERP